MLFIANPRCIFFFITPKEHADISKQICGHSVVSSYNDEFVLMSDLSVFMMCA